MAAAATPLSFDTFYNIIDGKLETTAETRQCPNPATESLNPAVPIATPSDVDAAVLAARRGFGIWSATPFHERQAALSRIGDAIEKEKENFAQLLTRENGKPLSLALREISMAAFWFRETAKLQLPEEPVHADERRSVLVRYTPLGVVAGIVPWNYPVMLTVGKIAPALLAGCAMIVKPSPFTPYCGLKIVELAQKFLPPGVLQALSGEDNLGPWLTGHSGIDKISFTGSTATGEKIMQAASKGIKRITLELGGNDPAIVCADADVQAAATKIATSAFMNSGQVCMAIKRIYVHEEIYDEFLQTFATVTKQFMIGTGKNAFIGPVQNKVQYDKVLEILDDIKAQEYTVVTGGGPCEGPGYFIQPTIVDNPPETSRIVQEEPFGPVVPIVKWKSLDDVIALANDTPAGLGASVWTSDLEAAQNIVRRIQAGSVWINTHLEASPHAPFSGHKQSGFGSEWGIEGLKQFCNVQALYVPHAS